MTYVVPKNRSGILLGVKVREAEHVQDSFPCRHAQPLWKIHHVRAMVEHVHESLLWCVLVVEFQSRVEGRQIVVVSIEVDQFLKAHFVILVQSQKRVSFALFSEKQIQQI
jgi:hypothetical protein